MASLASGLKRVLCCKPRQMLLALQGIHQSTFINTKAAKSTVFIELGCMGVKDG